MPRFTFLWLVLLPLLTARAQTTFTDVTSSAGISFPISGWGASWVDCDGDDDLDFFIGRNLSPGNTLSVLFRNLGNGTFERTTGPISNLVAFGSTWGDVDNDGDLDAITTGGTGSRLFLNDGTCGFTSVTNSPIAATPSSRGWAAAFGDYDNDGWLDAVIVHPANFLGPPPQQNHLFHNRGDGTFERVTSGPIVTGLAPYTVGTWSDYDLDGDIDFFIGAGPANGPAGILGPNYLYRNLLRESGSASFERITSAPMATDMVDGQVMNWVDYDNDRDLDLFSTNFFGSNPASNDPPLAHDFYRNDGGGTFTRLSLSINENRGAGLANTWGDVDNDGDLDVVVTMGGARLYLNNLHNGGEGFTLHAEGALATPNNMSSAASFGDYDNDGDLDLVGARQAPPPPPGGPAPTPYLFRNDLANGNGWLKVHLVGSESNRSGIGAKVYVRATIFGQERWMLREVSAQNTFNGQNALDPHFGLGDAAQIAEIRVEWPSGEVDVVQNVARNQSLTIAEGTNTPTETTPHTNGFRMGAARPNPTRTSTTFDFAVPMATPVHLALYDVLGRKVATLVDGVQAPGNHEVSFEAGALAPGLYLARLTAPLAVLTRSVVVID